MRKRHLNTDTHIKGGAQWLSGRVLDWRQRGRGFEPHRCHCVVSLSKNINPSLVLVQPRKTRPFITERLSMGCKESNQTNKHTHKRKHNLKIKKNIHWKELMQVYIHRVIKVISLVLSSAHQIRVSTVFTHMRKIS